MTRFHYFLLLFFLTFFRLSRRCLPLELCPLAGSPPIFYPFPPKRVILLPPQQLSTIVTFFLFVLIGAAGPLDILVRPAFSDVSFRDRLRNLTVAVSFPLLPIYPEIFLTLRARRGWQFLPVRCFPTLFPRLHPTH